MKKLLIAVLVLVALYSLFGDALPWKSDGEAASPPPASCRRRRPSPPRPRRTAGALKTPKGTVGRRMSRKPGTPMPWPPGT